MGVLTPDSGAVYWDNQNVNDISLRDCLYIGEPVCFSDTLVRNIVMSEEAPDEELLFNVLQDVGLAEKFADSGSAHDEILDPSKMSSGEKQRLSLARALYHDHRHFLLDEVTSAIDSITEQRLMDLLRIRSLQRKGILVIITHRLSLIREDDMVLFLRGNSSYLVGEHASVAGSSEEYRRMVSASMEVVS